jgi:hypothetical protein
MHGGLFPAVRRCLPVLASLAAVVATPLHTLSVEASPELSVAVSDACPSGAYCFGEVDFAPTGLHTVDATVLCVEGPGPVTTPHVASTTVQCTLVDTNLGILDYSGSFTANGMTPARLVALVPNLPAQHFYRLCVGGWYVLDNGFRSSTGQVCAVGQAPAA